MPPADREPSTLQLTRPRTVPRHNRPCGLFALEPFLEVCLEPGSILGNHLRELQAEPVAPFLGLMTAPHHFRTGFDHALVLRQDLLDQPAVIGIAERDLGICLRMHAERQHGGREHHHVIDAHGIHSALAKLHLPVQPGRGEFASAVNHLSSELYRVGVRVELGKEADVDTVKKQKPDAVVVATGATPLRPDIPGIDGSNVVWAWDVLERRLALGKRVVVIGGGAVGMETALFLAKQSPMSADSAVFLALGGALDAETAVRMTCRGPEVTILEMLDDLLLEDINTANRMMLLEMLNNSGVVSMTSAKVQEITAKGAVVGTNGTKKEIAGDSVVLAVGLTSQSQLKESLKDIPFEVFSIGDCVEPRKIINAIWEGFHTSRLI